MNKSHQQPLIDYIRGYFEGYIPSAYHYQIASHLEKISRGEIKRLIIEAPPRSGKSTLVSRYFPAWYLKNNPDNRIVYATFAQILSDKFANMVLEQFDEGDVIEGRIKRKEINLAPPYSGSYCAVGVGAEIGNVSERLADCVVIEDPYMHISDPIYSPAIQEEIKNWTLRDVYGSLKSNGAIVLCLTRVVENDLVDLLLRERKNENWTVLKFLLFDKEGKVLCPRMFPQYMVDNIKRAVSKKQYEAMYQQFSSLEKSEELR